MVLINPPAARLGKANAILSASARRHYVRDFPGPLSIKTVLRGSAEWRVEGRRFVIEPGTFLIVNESQPYTISIDSREPVETCCLFFERGFVESVHRAMVRPDGLDDAGPGAPVAFPTRIESGQRALLARLVNMRQSQEDDGAALLLARDVLLMREETAHEIARIPAVRASTREEIHRRLSLGRDFLHASLDGPVTLAGVARAACLSPYHFHRAFTKAFGMTPHEYVTERRLDRARRLLGAGLPVTEAALRSGFESLGSFSTLFKRRFGVSPKFARFEKTPAAAGC